MEKYKPGSTMFRIMYHPEARKLWKEAERLEYAACDMREDAEELMKRAEKMKSQAIRLSNM